MLHLNRYTASDAIRKQGNHVDSCGEIGPLLRRRALLVAVEIPWNSNVGEGLFTVIIGGVRMIFNLATSAGVTPAGLITWSSFVGLQFNRSPPGVRGRFPEESQTKTTARGKYMCRIK